MTNRPIDANIKAYIDEYVEEKLYGLDAYNFQDELDNLKARLETIELSSLQGQIDAQTREINSLENTLLSVRRSVAILDVKLETLWVIRYLQGMVRENPTMSNAGATTLSQVREITSFITGQLIEAQFPENAFNEFHRRVRPLLENNGFGDFYGS